MTGLSHVVPVPMTLRSTRRVRQTAAADMERQHEQQQRGARRADRGVTLPELLISAVVIVVVAGAAMFVLGGRGTSTSSTIAAPVAVNNDALIETIIRRDAQWVTASVEQPVGDDVADGDGSMPFVGVVASPSTLVERADEVWHDCGQAGAFVAAFGWVSPTHGWAMATYALDDGALLRRSCDGEDTVDTVIGRGYRSVQSICLPDVACGPLTETLSFKFVDEGVDDDEAGAATPDLTVTVPVRSVGFGEAAVGADLPPISLPAPVAGGPSLLADTPLVATGSGRCPAVSVDPDGSLEVVGAASVGGGCGVSPLAGDLTRLASVGGIGLLDTTASIHPDDAPAFDPVDACAAGPVTGSEMSVRAGDLDIVGAASFTRPVTVICGDLRIGAEARVSSDDAALVVVGDVVVEPDARVDLRAADDGALPGVALWVVSHGSVELNHDLEVSNYRGAVLAPTATVSFSGAAPVNVESLVAASIEVGPGARVRVGAFADRVISVPSLDGATVGKPVAETQIELVDATELDGAVVDGARLVAVGLPAGMRLEPDGRLVGTPERSGRTRAVITAIAPDGVASSTVVVIEVATSDESTDPPVTPEPSDGSELEPEAATCPDDVVDAWVGEYFDGVDLGSAPLLCRADTAIDADWAGGSPDPVLGVDEFSARWTRVFDLVAGSYRITTGSDDGIRVYVDGELVIDSWVDRYATLDDVEIELRGGRHEIVVEYYEHGGFASVTFELEPR
jgi:prepilin-type N-terminal cleavage/methylation domain-containing protein